MYRYAEQFAANCISFVSIIERFGFSLLETLGGGESGNCTLPLAQTNREWQFINTNHNVDDGRISYDDTPCKECPKTAVPTKTGRTDGLYMSFIDKQRTARGALRSL